MKSDFSEVLTAWPESKLRDIFSAARSRDVQRALEREELSPRDLAILLSPVASAYLEEMAQISQKLTRSHFGRTISLYAPLYLSNVCTSDCLYCGYAIRSGMAGSRRTLTEPEIHAECGALHAHGFESILLLTGDARSVVPLEYLVQAIKIARAYFVSIAVEIYSLDREEYRQIVDLGLEGVTLYMETYDRATYAEVHPTGRKKDFNYRLAAIERAGCAGVRRLSIGALLGLHDWRMDGFWTAMHAKYLQKKCWQSAIAVSFPRLLHTPDRYSLKDLPSNREFVQLMLAMRLFLPEVGFNLSTRERADFRDRLLHLGVTHMSAGSSTRPGGYASPGDAALPQFEIEDTRTPAEVAEAIRRAGYDPIWKDFDHSFHGAQPPDTRAIAAIK